MKQGFSFLIFGILLAVFGSMAQAVTAPAPAVILVDDFDQAYSSNHLGGAFGLVAQGGDVYFEFIKPPIPYLSNSSALKIHYKLKSAPSYAFLWMKLGKHKATHDVTDYLNLKQSKFLSFRTQSKQDLNIKIEIHEDSNEDGRFNIQDDRVSFIYTDSVKKFSLENGWTKILIPLKRFTGIKNWGRILELVFVLERDHCGASGELLLDDVLFIGNDLKIQQEDLPVSLMKNAKARINGKTPVLGLALKGSNQIQISYQPDKQFDDLESVSLELQASGQDSWVPVATEFNPGKNEILLKWEAYSFQPPDKISLRVVATDFFGKTQRMAGPFKDLYVPAMSDDEFLELVSQKAFLFFKDHQHESGLFYDTTGGGDLSTAVTGFGLAAFSIGAQRGWISREEASEKVLKALDSILLKMEHKEGFYYHFVDTKSLRRSGKNEVSTIDTALLMAGAITAGEYFGGPVKEKAQKLYERAQWDFFLDKDENSEHWMQFHHGWTPEEGLTDNYWDYYTDETLLLDLLAIGAPAYQVPPGIFYRFQRREGKYKDLPPFIYTWHGSLFSYQYANVWFDFRGLKDQKGINWYENSKSATLSSREFAIDFSAEYKTYGKDSWGITSMRTPERYIMHYGPLPNGQNKAEHDGTISPSGPGGSIIFAPYLSLRALKYLYIHHPESWGIYGFKDSINLDRSFVSPIYYGLGEGILLLGIENFRSGLVWKFFMQNAQVQKALQLTEFKKDKKPAEKTLFRLKKFEKQFKSQKDENLKILLFRQALIEKLSYEDAAILSEEIEKVFPHSSEAMVWRLRAGIKAKMIQALGIHEVEAGRRYLLEAESLKDQAMSSYEKALQAEASGSEHLEIYKEMIFVLEQVMAVAELDKVHERLADTLREGIQKKVYNLAWALDWAEKLDDTTALRLRRQFFNDLSGRDRKVMFESLKHKARDYFNQGDYRKAADLMEEQVRFMEEKTYHRVLISFLMRTAQSFSEVQKYVEAERFYLKIIDQYGDASDRETMMPPFAAMLEKKGDKELAIKEYEAYVEEFPESSGAVDAFIRIANIHSGLGNRDKAIEIFKKIALSYPQSSKREDALYFLGMIYYHADHHQEAIAAWEELLKKFPQTRRQAVIQEYLERADQKEAKKS